MSELSKKERLPFFESHLSTRDMTFRDLGWLSLGGLSQRSFAEQSRRFGATCSRIRRGTLGRPEDKYSETNGYQYQNTQTQTSAVHAAKRWPTPSSEGEETGSRRATNYKTLMTIPRNPCGAYLMDMGCCRRKSNRPLSTRSFRFFLLSSLGCGAAFHVSQLLFARHFVLGVLLTKISTCRGGRSSLLRPARLAFPGKKAAKEI
jgi:hypothetical protein